MTNTYKEATDTVLGEELLLYISTGGSLQPVAFASSHTLSMSADTIDTSNKMSGAWKAGVAGQIGWSISAEALVSRAVGHMSFATLADLMAKRKPIEVYIAERKATPLETEDPFAADIAKTWTSGTAYITSLDKKADRGAICTSSITLQGTGALVGANGMILGV